MKYIIAALLFILSLQNVQAAPQWWQNIYTPNSNSQITLKDDTGANVTAITNPTAASVKTNTNTSTQPPSIILQATATLPVAIRNTACDSTKKTVAITADHNMILHCPATNIWTADSSNGNITSDSTVAANNLQVNGTATVGAACAPNGKIAQDGTGLLLSCQSGVWKYTSSGPYPTITQNNAASNTVDVNAEWTPITQVFVSPAAGTYLVTITADCYQHASKGIYTTYRLDQSFYRFRTSISGTISPRKAIAGQESNFNSQSHADCSGIWPVTLLTGELIYFDAWAPASGVTMTFFLDNSTATAFQISP